MCIPGVRRSRHLDGGSEENVMLVEDGLELLSEDESRALLASVDVGRVGVSIEAIPAIFPVNFAVVGGDIVFRTSTGSKLSAAAHGAVVAFEVDEHDRASRTGWSVLVVGRSQVVHDLDVTWQVLHSGLEPYADGRRADIVRIRPELVTGRRIVHDERGE
jgi:nitroimidazol reductase NimA-like FMN-containing flavoprotein (pyridoxamine 5'-phosphate oxidase superfamily)